jgi:molecular chaperone HtpG
MTAEELESNLGVIARSGSLQFKKELGDKPTDVDIIGQFGVGSTRRLWWPPRSPSSPAPMGMTAPACGYPTGSDGYTITDCEKETVGTDIIIELKPDGDEDDYSTYLEEHTPRRHYQKVLGLYPLAHHDGGDEKAARWKQERRIRTASRKRHGRTTPYAKSSNSRVPIWQRPK